MTIRLKFLCIIVFVLIFSSCKKEEKLVQPGGQNTLSSPQLISPINELIPFLNHVDIRWTNTRNAVKYKLSFSTDSSFLSTVLIVYTSDTVYSFQKTDGVLNKRLFWTVQSINRLNEMSDITSYAFFEYKTASATKPYFILPENNSYIEDPVGKPVQLQWSAMQNIQYYELQGSYQEDFMEKKPEDPGYHFTEEGFIHKIPSLNNYILTAQDLSLNDTLFLRLRVKFNTDEWSDWSEIRVVIIGDERLNLLGTYKLKYFNFMDLAVDSELVSVLKHGRNKILIDAKKAGVDLYYRKYDYDNKVYGLNIYEFDRVSYGPLIYFYTENSTMNFNGTYRLGNSHLKITGERQ